MGQATRELRERAMARRVLVRGQAVPTDRPQAEVLADAEMLSEEAWVAKYGGGDQEAAAVPVPVPDLMEALRASVERPAVTEQREAEIAGVARDWSSWEEVEVAVVVFVKCRGADHGDAQDRAVDAVSRAVRGSRHDLDLQVTHRGSPVPGAAAEAVEVMELGRSATSGRLRVTPSPWAFR